MVPELLSSFEQMFASFAYRPPTGTGTLVGGGAAVAGQLIAKEESREKEDARPKKRSRGSPAPPPQTPPRPQKRVDGSGIGVGTAPMSRETTAVEAVAGSTPATTEDGRPERQQCPKLATPGGPGPPRSGMLSPEKVKRKKRNCGPHSSFLRKHVDGKPVIVSRYFCHQAPASSGGGETSQVDAAPHGRKNKLEGREPKRKKVMVVSPYFAASTERRALEGGAGVEVMVVVQRRTQKKRTHQPTESTTETPPTPTSSCCLGHLNTGDGKKKGKDNRQSVLLTAAERLSDAYKRVPDDCPWVPPVSDHELLQEIHHFDHWRVLVICMLLNRTTGREVRKILRRLFLLCPDAETTTEVSEEEIEQIIRPLGLQKKRSKMIKLMSQEYLGREWTHVTQLHGIGKYAADAYAIFCSGMWMEVKPNDHKLVDYWRFLLNDKDARESIKWQQSSSRADQSQE